MAQVARSPSDGGAINPAGKPHTACCGTIQLRTWTIKAQITAGILSVSGALLATLTLWSQRFQRDRPLAAETH